MQRLPNQRRSHRRLAGLILAAALGVGACQRTPMVRVAAPDAYPERLSEWGIVVRRGNRLALGGGVEPYEVATPLFSDYALKLRTVYLPAGEAMRYRRDDAFEFPVGSVISKTFFYPGHNGKVSAAGGWDGDVAALDLDDYRLVETRLLVRQADGWDALPYVWDGDDAYLRITGAVRPFEITLADRRTVPMSYVVPARSECAGCHATNHTSGKLLPIGLKARHLNYPYPGRQESQLDAWAGHGRLAGLPSAAERPVSVVWNDPGADLDARARAYLDSNCGHCHNPAGAADTSGLLLDAGTTSLRHVGFCKAPVAAGRGTGGRAYAIVPGRPDQSILIYRMETVDPATRMPEAGRTLRHDEGVALLREWVASLPGACV